MRARALALLEKKSTFFAVCARSCLCSPPSAAFSPIGRFMLVCDECGSLDFMVDRKQQVRVF